MQYNTENAPDSSQARIDDIQVIFDTEKEHFRIKRGDKLLIVDSVILAEEEGSPRLCLASTIQKKWLMVALQEEQKERLRQVMEEEQLTRQEPCEYILDWVSADGELEGYTVSSEGELRVPLYEGLIQALHSGAVIKLAPYLVEFTSDLEEGMI